MLNFHIVLEYGENYSRPMCSLSAVNLQRCLLSDHCIKVIKSFTLKCCLNTIMFSFFSLVSSFRVQFLLLLIYFSSCLWQVHNLVVVVSTKSHNIVTQDAIGMMALPSILSLALNLDLMKDSTRTEVMRSSSEKLGQMLLQQKWQGWMEMLLSQQLWPGMPFEDRYQIYSKSSSDFHRSVFWKIILVALKCNVKLYFIWSNSSSLAVDIMWMVYKN